MTPLEASTQLLLHLNETDGAFVDSSGRRSKLNFNGAPGTSLSAKFGAACFSDTGGSALAPFSVQLPVHSLVPMVCDFWVNLSAYRTDQDCRILRSNIYIDVAVQTAAAGGRVFFSVFDTGNNAVRLTAADPLPLNEWVHVLIGIDENSTRRVFYNGVSQGASSSAMSHRATSSLSDVGVFGDLSSANRRINGRVDELRYVFGYPCPSADFTPPTAPYDDIPRSLLNAKIADAPSRLLGTAPDATNFKLAQQPVFLRDHIGSGFGRIVGTVKEKSTPTNVPLRRKVRLFHELSGRFIRETWSDDAGNYAFTGIDPTHRYTVVSYDYLQNYRAVIADNILPEVMA